MVLKFNEPHIKSQCTQCTVCNIPAQTYAKICGEQKQITNLDKTKAIVTWEHIPSYRYMYIDVNVHINIP